MAHRDFNYQYPTADELRPFLGDSWTICRATPANLSRYALCITRKQFKAAQAMAIAARVTS